MVHSKKFTTTSMVGIACGSHVTRTQNMTFFPTKVLSLSGLFVPSFPHTKPLHLVHALNSFSAFSTRLHAALFQGTNLELSLWEEGRIVKAGAVSLAPRI